MKDFTGYQLLDSGLGERLEQWGPYLVRRPDKSVQWPRSNDADWDSADVHFISSDSATGRWETKNGTPKEWNIEIGGYRLKVGLGSTKQLGVFPEQAELWHKEAASIQSAVDRQPSVKPQILNLFAYTGAASIACTKAGGFVTHVDSNHAAIARAKENQLLNSLPTDSIRWIKEDVVTFLQREVRRGKKYDGIIMDPPAFGHGPRGEQFVLAKQLSELLQLSQQLLSDSPLFVCISTYAHDWPPQELEHQCHVSVPLLQHVESGYLRLQQQESDHWLTTGVFTWLS